MPNELKARLEELAALWVAATPESFREIPQVCATISCVVSDAALAEAIDSRLVQRVKLLADKASERLNACVAIQSRTGSYSTHGEIEVAAQIVTDTWEG